MKRIFFAFFLFFSIVAAAQKRVTVIADGLFPFDPISGRYVARSIAPAVTYVEAWRAEGQVVDVKVIDSLSFGYRHYCQQVDTTLKNRVLSYLDAKVETDTTIRPVDISGFPQDQLFLQSFDSDIERIKRYFATPLRLFDTSAVYDPYAPCDFMALFHTFQIESSSADLSIVAPPRLEVMLQKECYIKHIDNMLRFENELVVVRLSGSQIKKIMEESYARKFYQVRVEESDLLRIFTPAYLYQSISSVPHTINLTKPAGRRIENWPLADNTIYSVAFNSFAARQLPIDRKIGDYKTLMINWLKTTDNPFLVRENFQLQPARIVEKIVEREVRTIFGK